MALPAILKGRNFLVSLRGGGFPPKQFPSRKSEIASLRYSETWFVVATLVALPPNDG
jgi:hypothetical protein